MKRFLASILLVAGCGQSPMGQGVLKPKADLAFGGFGDDDAGNPTDDAGNVGQPNNCGDTDTACQDVGLGPDTGGNFPLGTDPMKDPNEKDDGVGRDAMGWLGLNQSHAAFDFLWVANSEDWSRGTVSKLNSKTVREVARYSTVTCYSLPTGSRQSCDGNNGCCAFDDNPRWLARQAKMAQPAHQGILLQSNSPSRTAIDFNGDLFVANRAFGGQSSVSKIANDLTEWWDPLESTCRHASLSIL